MFDLFSDFIIKRTLGREARVEFSKIHYSVQTVFPHISLEISTPIQLHAIIVAIYAALCKLHGKSISLN